MEFIEYSKCSTCIKAKKYLDLKNIKYSDRAIKENTPTYEELDCWVKKYNVDIKRLFNTSGLKYKELKLKNKLNDMSYEEKLKLLSSDGMLIKRPILVLDNKILIGFKEKEWNDVLSN